MTNLLLILNAVAAIFAVAFTLLYLRIILLANEIGPAPMSWILFAVGAALIAASAVLEAILVIEELPIVFHTEKVYFMLGNILLFTVLIHIWWSMGGGNHG